MNKNRRRPWWLGLCICTVGSGIWLLLPAVAEKSQPRQAEAYDSSEDVHLLAQGRELFHRNWLPDDPRSPDGDGLGPVFNETSCVACHNQGAPGGGGAASKNVELLTAFVSQPQIVFLSRQNRNQAPQSVRVAPRRARRNAQSRQAINKELEKIHPGFLTGSSVVVHRFGTSPKHTTWRENLLAAGVLSTMPTSPPASLPEQAVRRPEPRTAPTASQPLATVFDQPDQPRPVQATAPSRSGRRLCPTDGADPAVIAHAVFHGAVPRARSGPTDSADPPVNSHAGFHSAGWHYGRDWVSTRG